TCTSLYVVHAGEAQRAQPTFLALPQIEWVDYRCRVEFTCARRFIGYSTRYNDSGKGNYITLFMQAQAFVNQLAE
ncbi:MAG: hypothetical protein WBN51_03455, partial [Gammaproteobacteria bacterium]